MKVRVMVFLAAAGAAALARAEPDYATATDLSYYGEETLKTATDYQKEQCKLDVSYVRDRPEAPVLVWFHGGGLTGGWRGFPALDRTKFHLVAVGYRLSPEGDFPCFLEDAAAATAWTIQNIGRYGGDPERVFVGGHSAGGYLALMVGMDGRWLKSHGIGIDRIAGLIPVSAQVTTHFHVKKLRGDTGEPLRPLIDEFAPLYHSAKELPPICLITGDRGIEFKSRVEENVLFAITLKNLGHERHEFHELPGLDHGTVEKGGMELVGSFMEKVMRERERP